MKKIAYLFLSLLTFSCKNIKTNADINVDNSVKLKDTEIVGNQPFVKQIRDTMNQVLPRFVLIPDSIASSLMVHVISVDEVYLYITLFNKTSQSINLYRPILPNDTLIENHFFLNTYERHEHVVPIISHYTQNAHQYYFDNSGEILLIKPELKEENFIELYPMDSIRFEMNLAKRYDFKSLSKKGKHKFILTYVALLPMVRNLQHIWEKDESFVNKPVYYLAKDVDGVVINVPSPARSVQEK